MHDFLTANVQEPACVHLGVGIVTTKLLDQDSFVFESPDLRDLERGVDAKSVGIFDGEISISIARSGLG